jgi:flavin reductase
MAVPRGLRVTVFPGVGPCRRGRGAQLLAHVLEKVSRTVTLVNRETYREAMARFGAAVSIVTTDGAGGRFGFTASAVTSVTDDPPTLLVCVNRRNDSHPALMTNKVFCISTLAAGQEEISGVFGGKEATQEARYAVGAWHTLATGAPVLAGAVVSFDCRVVQITEIGTHSVVFGEVVAIEHGSAHDGLVYFGRSYHTLRRPTLP